MINQKLTNQENHIYYDISFYNDKTIPIEAKINENRNQQLIDNPNNYYLSVIRFLIPTAYIPIFIWPEDDIAKNNTANNNFYSITIRRAGVDYQQFLTYVPQNNLTSFNPEFRFVYSYQQFIDAINVAFNQAFISAGGSATKPIYMTYNSDSGIISIIAEYPYANALGEYEIYMNNNLYSFFNNFKVKTFGYNNASGKDVLIYIENQGDNDYASHPPNYPISTTLNSYKIDQEFNSLYNWYDVRSIILQSNSIPVAHEFINVQNTTTPNSSSSSLNILTDFEPQIESGNNRSNVRSYLQYVPPGEYRLIDLKSNSPIYKTDIQISFITSDQKIYPLKIFPGEYVSIKILFRNKNVKKLN